jgi:hypothetical protein
MGHFLLKKGITARFRIGQLNSDHAVRDFDVLQLGGRLEFEIALVQFR